MKFTQITATLALAASAIASPTWPSWNGCPSDNCISQTDAETLVKRFIGVLSHEGSDLGNASVTANAILADNYKEISDSILSLEGLPVRAS